MISKETFINTFKFIKEQRDKQENLIKAFEELCPGEYCNCYLYSNYESTLINILKEDLDDKYEDIEYFIYDLDGLDTDVLEEDRCPKDDKNKILYNSIETLYDFLMKERNKTDGN